MLTIKSVHHIAIICADYQKSKDFYTRILGLNPIQEIYREERASYKLDLAIGSNYIIELFSFPNPPKRTSAPEAAGLRHVAFQVDDIDAAAAYFHELNIEAEAIRIDTFTNKKFFFIQDPDQLPIEFYET